MDTDNNKEPIINLPPATLYLVAANALIFGITSLLPEQAFENTMELLAFIPARLVSETFSATAFTSLITHMFLHASLLHLAINLSMMAAFGTAVERRLGARKMLLLYFLSGIAGALLHTLLYPAGGELLVGASGAISGLFGFVLLNINRQNGGNFKKTLPIILIWIAVSVIFGIFGMPGVEQPIAWTAHVGGFLFGLLFYKAVSQNNYINQ